MQVQATTATNTYDLPANKTVSIATAKSTNNDFVSYRLVAVWPYEGNDNCTRIKLAAYYGKSALMKERVIFETTDRTKVNFKVNEGIDLSKGDLVKFSMRGNNPIQSAYAKVALNWF